MAQASIPRLVKMAEILAITSLASRSSIHRLMRQGRFPPPCSIGAGQIRWREVDIRAWLEALPTRVYPTVDAAVSYDAPRRNGRRS